jgi:hypothetical protein
VLSINKGGNGYNDSIKIAYEFDATGDIGFTDSYVGILYLGADPKRNEKFIYQVGGATDTLPTVAFTSWQFRNTSDPNFFAPQDDNERYQKMHGYFGGSNWWKNGINPESLRPPSNRSLFYRTDHSAISRQVILLMLYLQLFVPKSLEVIHLILTPKNKKRIFIPVQTGHCEHITEKIETATVSWIRAKT